MAREEILGIHLFDHFHDGHTSFFIPIHDGAMIGLHRGILEGSVR